MSQCEIDDVFLVESSCRGNRLVNQLQGPVDVTCQFRLNIDHTGSTFKRMPVDDKLVPIFIVRYFITGEMRILNPGVVADEETEVTEDQILARISLTFGVDYRCPESLLSDNEALSAYTKNAAWHVWPFWREAVHEMVGRMRLVPMLKPDSLTANKLLGVEAPKPVETARSPD